MGRIETTGILARAGVDFLVWQISANAFLDASLKKPQSAVFSSR
jgi:hypothetical protein